MVMIVIFLFSMIFVMVMLMAVFARMFIIMLIFMVMMMRAAKFKFCKICQFENLKRRFIRTNRLDGFNQRAFKRRANPDDQVGFVELQCLRGFKLEMMRGGAPFEKKIWLCNTGHDPRNKAMQGFYSHNN